MHKARAALRCTPRCAGLFAFGQIAGEILAALLRGGAVGKRSGINPQFRHLRGLPGKRQWIPVPGRPIEGQHDDKHRRVGRYLQIEVDAE